MASLLSKIVCINLGRVMEEFLALLINIQKQVALKWSPMTFFIVTIGFQCQRDWWKKLVKALLWTSVIVRVSLWKTSVKYLHQNIC